MNHDVLTFVFFMKGVNDVTASVENLGNDSSSTVLLDPLNEPPPCINEIEVASQHLNLGNFHVYASHIHTCIA